MANDRIKVVGYAQKKFFGSNIEYRNFTPDLVGLQQTTDGGSPIFTSGNFAITTNFDDRLSKLFNTKKFSNFVTLSDLDLTVEKTISLLSNNANVSLNLDSTNVNRFALFGSLSEYLRISLEGIITNWPASLYVNPNVNSIINLAPVSGLTYQNYIYDSLTNVATFRVDAQVINNKFGINFLKNGSILNTYNATNDLRNLVVSYSNYSILVNNTEFDIIGLTGATDINGYLLIQINGNPFIGVNGYIDFHIKPKKIEEELFFNKLDDFQLNLLNRKIIPKFTATFNYSVKTDLGSVLLTQRTLTWPVSDGYNIDFDTTRYEDYANNLLDIAISSDEISSNLMTRFLVTESISSFDTMPVFLDSLSEDTSGGKMNKILNVYGREFDDINKFITGIEFANTVTYDKKDNTPDIYVKSLARILGWDLVSSVLENDLLKNYVTRKPASYSGHTVGLTAVEADTELWRRLILNTPWIWKSKSTRKVIEFLFRFIGTPQGLINFNEYVYLAKNQIDTNILEKALILNNVSSDLDLYPVDSDGFPNPLPNTPDMYFQNNGLWYRETGGMNSDIDILDGNNPHVGPYDGGGKYMDQFRNLIPNFSAVTISSETLTTKTKNLFTNYFNGTIDGYTGATFVEAKTLSNNDISDCINLHANIIANPKPNPYYNDCGCETGNSNNILSIAFNNVESCSGNSITNFKIYVNSKGYDGSSFIIDDNTVNEIEVEFNYLFRINCSSVDSSACGSITKALESLDVSLNLERIDGTTYSSVLEQNIFPAIGEGNLYSYLSEAEDLTGIYISDDNFVPISLFENNNNVNFCQNVRNKIVSDLFNQFGLTGDSNEELFKESLSTNAVNSNWLRFYTKITDPNIINSLKNKKIKLSFIINNSCVDLSILIDNIKINQNVITTKRNDIFVTKPIGFELERVRDNKKSWSTDTTTRNFKILKTDGTTPTRITNYTVTDDRQVINSKEVDIDISIAKAIESDVWSYISDNPCILTGNTINLESNICSSMSVYTAVTRDTILTSTTVVTSTTVTSGVTEVTSKTVSSIEFTCPTGYSLTPNKDKCEQILTIQATFNSYGPIIVAGDKNPTHFGIYGAWFFPQINTDLTSDLSLHYTGDTQNLVGNNGVVYSPTNVSNNSFWGSHGTDSGRLNEVGILPTDNEWAGFTHCLNIDTPGVYYVGIGADNFCQFSLNGVMIFDTGNVYPWMNSFQAWNVFPIYLNSGTNIIEMKGQNLGTRTSTNTGSFGAEIYKPTSFAALTAATTIEQTGVIFSTKDKIGLRFDVGETVGYSCPTSPVLYKLSTCSSSGYECIHIDIADVTEQSVDTILTGTTVVYSDVVVTGNSIVVGTAVVTGITYTTGTTEYCCNCNTKFEEVSFPVITGRTYVTTSTIPVLTQTQIPQVVITANTDITTSIEITSSTATTITYSCPSGYSATPANDACKKILETTATFNGSGSKIVIGDTSTNYSIATYFFPQIDLNSSVLPFHYGNDDNYGKLIDQSGGILSNDFQLSSSFWGTDNTINGRLNSAGILAYQDEWVGFSECVNIPESGTYYVGIGADNFCQVTINEVLIFDTGILTASTSNFNIWTVFPIHLDSGANIIKMLGRNESGPTNGNPSAFAAEIYHPTNLAALTAATNTVDAGVIFSTLSKRGKYFDVGTTVGYSCPTSYSPVSCTEDGGIICRSIIVTGITAQQTETTITGETVVTDQVTVTGETTIYTVVQTYTDKVISGVTTETGVTTLNIVNVVCGDNDNGFSCGDNHFNISSLVTEPINELSVIDDFQKQFVGELIDAKSRQTISSYPTLRSVYDRYLNSEEYCNKVSSKFNYSSMDAFTKLIGNYWNDLIEQVIPSTTIWGATKIFTNTIFDMQKFQYKRYTLEFGDDNYGDGSVLSPCNGNEDIDITTSIIMGDVSASLIPNFNIGTYKKVYIKQLNIGSEFIGRVITESNSKFISNV